MVDHHEELAARTQHTAHLPHGIEGPVDVVDDAVGVHDIEAGVVEGKAGRSGNLEVRG